MPAPKSMKDMKKRDLAEEWAEGEDHRKTPDNNVTRALDKFAEGLPRRSRKGIGGVKRGSHHRSTTAIKEFMLGVLDNPKYRKSLQRRMLAGELPQVELFMLTKTLGKPVEEINVTANVPLFSLPTAFVMREDEPALEGEVVPPKLGPGDDDAKGDGGSTS